jgi:hypothetical protein
MKPTDELRQRQIDQILITLKAAYNYYAQQDIPESIFDILFNHTLPGSSDNQLDQDQAVEERNEIYQLLWRIIETNKRKTSPTKEWIPGSILYPSIIIQLLRARFPSSEPDILLPNCTKYSMEEFILYTCTST